MPAPPPHLDLFIAAGSGAEGGNGSGRAWEEGRGRGVRLFMVGGRG